MFSGRAARVRDIGVLTALCGSALLIGLGLLATLSTAVVYGLGGSLVINGALQLGALVALATLLTPAVRADHALSNVQVNVMTALVSFDRVFEVLDLKPLIDERPGALALRGRRPGRRSSSTTCRFRYPGRPRCRWRRWSRSPSRSPSGSDAGAGVLHDVDLHRAGRAADGAGRAVGRGQDHDQQPGVAAVRPRSGAIRIGGSDMRDVTLESLHDAVGVVTQDAHMFHDTIRANLLYARPEATEDELVAALPGGADLGPGLGRCPTGSTRSWATAATGCRAARSSGSPWPGCCSRPRRWSCSTRPPRTWTPSPRRPCSAR